MAGTGCAAPPDGCGRDRSRPTAGCTAPPRRPSPQRRPPDRARSRAARDRSPSTRSDCWTGCGARPAAPWSSPRPARPSRPDWPGSRRCQTDRPAGSRAARRSRAEQRSAMRQVRRRVAASADAHDTAAQAVRCLTRMATKHSTFFLQSSHGGIGNFELLVRRLAGGGAAHFWRNNDDPVLPWIASGLAFGSPDDVYSVSLIQGPLGAAGNLEAVALEGSQLVHHWRDDGGSWRWQARTVLPGSVPITHSVALIQSSHGTLGNYEVVAA